MTATAATRVPIGRTVEEFDRWVAGAKTGERLLFAEGDRPPYHLPVWAHAGDAAREGVVHIHHRRAEAGWWHFVAARAAPAEPGTANAKTCLAEVEASEPTEAVLRAVRRAANFDRPCPSNAELAQLCGLKDAAAASYRLRILRDLGRIRIVDYGPGLPRVITICASGKSTAKGGGRVRK